MRNFGFFLRETFEGIRRHSSGSLVTFSQVFITLFLLGISLVFIITINHIVDKFLNNLEMGAFLSNDLTYDQSVELMDVVSNLPGVRNVEYVSKEEAFGLMEQQTTVDISDYVSENPLPASLRITVTSPQAAEELAETIGLLEGVTDVTYGESQLQTILTIFYGLELISFFSAVFMAGATMVTINNTIRLAILSRRKEIRIMQLVGATNGFIRLPFLIEGFLYGVGGAALSLGIIAIGYGFLIKYVQEHYIFNPWIVDHDLMMGNLAIMLFVLGTLIGVIASLIAVDKHLRDETYRPRLATEGVAG
jgi:cell division transport system permease protein